MFKVLSCWPTTYCDRETNQRNIVRPILYRFVIIVSSESEYDCIELAKFRIVTVL